MKTTRVASGRQLPEDAVTQAELRFDYHVHHVVRHERVVTRSWAHQQMRQPRALRFHRIPSLTGATKHEYHFDLQCRRSSIDSTAGLLLQLFYALGRLGFREIQIDLFTSFVRERLKIRPLCAGHLFITRLPIIRILDHVRSFIIAYSRLTHNYSLLLSRCQVFFTKLFQK
jgi:hypothetical protein